MHKPTKLYQYHTHTLAFCLLSMQVVVVGGLVSAQSAVSISEQQLGGHICNPKNVTGTKLSTALRESVR